MLTFTGDGKAYTCNGVTRRDFLQVGALGAIGLSLPGLLAAQEAGAVKPGHDDRACIMIFNLGAPSNMDLWDMKPDAPAEIRGPFKPVASKVPGISSPAASTPRTWGPSSATSAAERPTCRRSPYSPS
jgi:hypothetical protein